jgi:hypothetical protein
MERRSSQEIHIVISVEKECEPLVQNFPLMVTSRKDLENIALRAIREGNEVIVDFLISGEWLKIEKMYEMAISEGTASIMDHLISQGARISSHDFQLLVMQERFDVADILFEKLKRIDLDEVLKTVVLSLNNSSDAVEYLLMRGAKIHPSHVQIIREMVPFFSHQQTKNMVEDI